MIFLGNLETISDTKAKPQFVHFLPFDEANGLGKTQEQLESEGMLVDSIPDPVAQQGKIPVLYVNPQTKEAFYEYIDAPANPPTVEDEIAELKRQLADAQIAINMALGL